MFMSIFYLSKSEKVFALKTSIIAVSLMIVVIIIYEFIFNSNNLSREAKASFSEASKQLSASEIPMYYEMKCIGGIPKIPACNKKFFEPLMELLEEKNIYLNKGGMYMSKDVDFILHYYAGSTTFCNVNACAAQTYYVQMQVQQGEEIKKQFTIKKEYHIEHMNNGISSVEQLAKLEEIGPLKFEETQKLLKFLGELSEEKQKALVN